jgi:raffinose/stachyose/melibiose transport system permease protein
MAVIIAFKKPSEMTNDVAGALSFPSKWSFSNFTEAMKVTDFWHSLGNSLLITIVTIVLAILIHSIAGYVIGRGMARKKSFRFIYLYIVSGMFVPFSILMMPLVKQTAQMGLGNRAGVIILYLVFYMPMNVLLYSGYLKNIPMALEEAADIDGASTWTTYWRVVFPMMKPMHATVAILTALGTWNDVMTPLVIMSGTGQNTLPLAQLNFQTQF